MEASSRQKKKLLSVCTVEYHTKVSTSCGGESLLQRPLSAILMFKFSLCPLHLMPLDSIACVFMDSAKSVYMKTYMMWTVI